MEDHQRYKTLCKTVLSNVSGNGLSLTERSPTKECKWGWVRQKRGPPGRGGTANLKSGNQ